MPQFRKQVYGTLLCQHLEVEAQKRGINQLHLFTDTAESLYRHLGWREVERLTWHNREIVVMEKTLGEAP